MVSARRACFAVGLVALIAGCGRPEPAHPVSWYREHPQELKARIEWCVDDAARRQSDDCKNALAAGSQQALGKMRDSPPIDWNKPDPVMHKP